MSWIEQKREFVVLRFSFILVQGNRVDVYVKGLHPSGDLKSMPGEDVELLCVAIGNKKCYIFLFVNHENSLLFFYIF